ncbi:MAG TPA: hypothetical protein VMU53_20810 [Candidatus Sulfotelmatobacter sp.]|nr:hypothetical protein [Candidatus Sulfotelmatobacter sp.]
MSIQKKSLISTLKTTKKANVISSMPEAAHKMSTPAVKTSAVKTSAVKTSAVKTVLKKKM